MAMTARRSPGKPIYGSWPNHWSIDRATPDVVRSLEMTKYLYWTLLIGTCAYTYWRGRTDERLTASLCLLATIATIALAAPYPARYSGVEDVDLLIDLAMLVVFVVLALRSERFWPLWVAGLQLTMTTAHVLKAVDQHIVPQVYAVAERFWSYPILVILIVATWRGARQSTQELGLPG